MRHDQLQLPISYHWRCRGVGAQSCSADGGRFKALSCRMLSERYHGACSNPTIKTVADDVKVSATKTAMLLSDFESDGHGLAGEVTASKLAPIGW